jgi:hypothetical protein
MSAMSDYLENEILDHILGTGAYTMPTTVYVGLATASFNDDNSGTELSGSGYARQSAAFNAAASGTAKLRPFSVQSDAKSGSIRNIRSLPMKRDGATSNVPKSVR